MAFARAPNKYADKPSYSLAIESIYTTKLKNVCATSPNMPFIDHTLYVDKITAQRLVERIQTALLGPDQKIEREIYWGTVNFLSGERGATRDSSEKLYRRLLAYTWEYVFSPNGHKNKTLYEIMVSMSDNVPFHTDNELKLAFKLLDVELQKKP